MMIVQRAFYILGLAIVEATPVALLLTVFGSGGWGALIGIVLLCALADWLVQRWLPVERQRPVLLVVAVVLTLWLVKWLAAGDSSLLDGWDQAFGALLDLSGPRNGIAYLALLCGLYTCWRGIGLLAHDSITLRQFFGRATVAMLVLVALGAIVAGSQPAFIAPATIQVLTFFAVGLVTLALVNAFRESETRPNGLDWRGLLTLLGAVALVLGLGLALVSLFGGQVAPILGAIWRIIALLIGLILVPIAYVLISVLGWLFRLLNVPSILESLQQMIAQQQQQQQNFDLAPPGVLPPWLEASIRFLLGLLPILLLVALIIFSRRRGRRPIQRDEERESLWSWAGLGADLRDLLARLRNPFADDGGLRAILARLRGADPVSRIRRSYIRLLLAGEARERPRTPPQTPREYEPEADALLPAAARPIATLTDAYERARYHPSAATAADADAAERAWGDIDAANRS